MRIFGLTGGTGSGKSEAAKRFVERGIPVIDADAVGHEILDSDPLVRDAIVVAFGEDILTTAPGERRIDRGLLGERVFSDPVARLQLNAIMHPRIIAAMMAQCAELERKGYCAIIIDAAVIAEGSRREPWISGLILVLSAVDKRLERLVHLRGMDPVQARKRIEAQMPPENKRSFADWIIVNDGTVEELRRQVDEVLEEMDVLGTAESVAVRLPFPG